MAKKSGRQQSKNRTQRQRTRRQGARAQKQRTQGQRSQKQRTQGQRKQRTQRRTKKRPLNAFMQKLNTARKSGAKSFEYNGNTYNKKMLKTGMVVYKSA